RSLLFQSFFTIYNTPFVLGNCIFSASRRTAFFIDFAKALKIASILWCSLSPSALIFKFDFDASENDLKKWENISVGISPIFLRLHAASHTIHCLPLYPVPTCAKHSSMRNVLA